MYTLVVSTNSAAEGQLQKTSTGYTEMCITLIISLVEASL